MKYLTILIFILAWTIMAEAADIPKEAIKHMARGEAAIEIASSDSGYQKAVDEFQKAIAAAPDWPAPYYNLAMVQEKIGEYAQAIINLQKYLELNPNANDAQSIETYIYKLEFKRDNPPEPQPTYEVVTPPTPIAQRKDYSHLNGQWCLQEYPESCFEMSVNGASFTLKRTQAVGAYGLVLYRQFKGTIDEKGTINGKYHHAQSFPGKCNGQAVWYRSPGNLLNGSRLYPGEEEMFLRFHEACYQMDESTCEGIESNNCVPYEVKMHFVRS